MKKGESPVLGVVYVPVRRKMYWGVKSKGSFCKVVGENEVKRLECTKFSERDQGLTIVGSSSHPSQITATFLSKFSEPNSVMVGSSLKFMMVAEGDAAIYPRFAPTCEWDTCASQIIVEEAGGIWWLWLATGM